MRDVNVSIIVCTFNRASALPAALQSLTDLRTNDGTGDETGDAFAYEIVVVDNASTDETPAVVEQFASRSAVPMRGVVERQQGVSFARNRGIREARGEWIAFFDDDQLADRGWLAALLSCAAGQGCRCVGGAVRLHLQDGAELEPGPVARALLGATEGRDVLQPYTRKFSPGTGNLLVHRSVFDEVGGFDESLSQAGEDTDLFRRIRGAGIAAWYTPEAVVHHVIPPERTRRDHLLRTSLRIGSHLAQREHHDYRGWVFPLILWLRMAQALVQFGPRWLGSRLAGRRDRRLDADCLAARSVGYFRNGLRLLCPSAFAQRTFFSGLEFRAERAISAGSR